MKKNTKKEGSSQDNSLSDVFAELDEDILALGPRLFDDEWFDNSVELTLENTKVKHYAKHKGQTDKAKESGGRD